MRLTQALLVIVDISGYTKFITQRTTSLLHAEQIVTELLEAVIDKASHPLVLNKLQGDAALLYREFAPADAAAATQDVLAQVGAFFPAFAACRARLAQARSGCGCEACSNAETLALKAFVHVGEIAIKQVRQFEELAGEPVIFVHRLLKNTVGEREYVLVSDEVRRLLPAALASAKPHREQLEGLGECELWLTRAGGLPAGLRAVPAGKPAAAQTTPAQRDPAYLHLPQYAGPLAWWVALKRRLAG